MYCPKCQKHREGAFCPECGTKLVEDPVNTIGGLHLGDANAISGGIHYSQTNNVTNNVTNNNTTVYEAQKTDAQIAMDNMAAFMEVAMGLMVNGILDSGGMAELERKRIILNIPREKASEIIDSVRKSSVASTKGATDYLTRQVLDDVKGAIQSIRLDFLKSQIAPLRQMTSFVSDEEVHYYCHLLSASFTPEVCVVDLASSSADDYWLFFWAYISNLKLGNKVEVSSLLQKISAFGRNKGDISILLVANSLIQRSIIKSEDDKRLTDKYLEQAVMEGISDCLFPVWRTLREMTEESGSIEDSIRFYSTVTFKEWGIPSGTYMPAASAPGIDPQRIVLPQMQGFNPLEAANRMELGQLSPIQSPDLNDNNK